ncbi:probable protein phosphatase 2C 42 isoform X2 [Arachis duranensis]|uniref:protein-serine/threonine phosphatase n=1 Tax=Arachis duranensis TaxID=130453 RepID=A0A6P4CZG5_ARADU|nr:probable protein phosphatase 2C 42 isoform X2 [Arachis duranensis]XP_029153608.1 probable protein phosphatase 2C 42 isoform X3 [Arachis hypogaea]XP_057756803.1 probable protein phosphatase 2C 42 isoform X3 [Arachis stenosperma]
MMNLLSLCWKPFGHGGGDAVSSAAGREGKDGLLWFRDVGRYGSGEFSMAVVQANQVLEDQSQIESGPLGTFVGVYDGHGGPDASRYVCDNLFRNFQAASAESQGVVTAETIQTAFRRTEEGFTALVSDLWSTRPQVATTGTCCLVGVIFQQTLFVANLGDSRVVLGKKVGNTGGVAAIQLSAEHNANLEAVRQELKELHPDDPQIVVLKHGVWRVKGIIQVSRSIDGLWEHLSNERAVDIVHSNPRVGSAKRLVKAALQEAARKREMRYSDLRKIDKKVRRHFHDDITVIVLFLNHDLISRGTLLHPPLSIRSALDH